MTDSEKANFSRMVNMMEEEVVKLRNELETLKTKEIETMERRMKDKIRLGELEKDINTMKIELNMKDFVIDDLLAKIDGYEEQLGITHEPQSIYPAYCGTGKEL